MWAHFKPSMVGLVWVGRKCYNLVPLMVPSWSLHWLHTFVAPWFPWMNGGKKTTPLESLQMDKTRQLKLKHVVDTFWEYYITPGNKCPHDVCITLGKKCPHAPTCYPWKQMSPYPASLLPWCPLRCSSRSFMALVTSWDTPKPFLKENHYSRTSKWFPKIISLIGI